MQGRRVRPSRRKTPPGHAPKRSDRAGGKGILSYQRRELRRHPIPPSISPKRTFLSRRPPPSSPACNQPAPPRLTPLGDSLPACLESGFPGGIVNGGLLRLRSISHGTPRQLEGLVAPFARD